MPAPKSLEAISECPCEWAKIAVKDIPIPGLQALEGRLTGLFFFDQGAESLYILPMVAFGIETNAFTFDYQEGHAAVLFT